MKTTGSILLCVTIAAALGFVHVARAQDDYLDSDISDLRTTVVASQMDDIRGAADPSAAIDAYARAVAINPDSIAAREAFVARMVELGVPEMAHSQARELTRRKSDSALAWAVLADVDARRGQTEAALSELVTAVRRGARLPLVQQLAGRMMAWYDTQVKQEELPDDLRQSLDLLRNRMQRETAFAETYEQARQAYEQGEEPDDSVALPAEPAPGPVVQTPVAPPTYQNPPVTTYVEPTYPSVYDTYVGGNPYYYPSYPSYYDSSSWWDTPSVVVVPSYNYWSPGYRQRGHVSFGAHWGGGHSRHRDGDRDWRSGGGRRSGHGGDVVIRDRSGPSRGSSFGARQNPTFGSRRDSSFGQRRGSTVGPRRDSGSRRDSSFGPRRDSAPGQRRDGSVGQSQRRSAAPPAAAPQANRAPRGGSRPAAPRPSSPAQGFRRPSAAPSAGPARSAPSRSFGGGRPVGARPSGGGRPAGGGQRGR